MSGSSRKANWSDPDYQAAAIHLQQGEWQAGLSALNELAARFPHDLELKAYIDESQVRAGIDLNERQDQRRALWRRLARWAGRLAVVLVLAAGAWWAWQAYADWFERQAVLAGEIMAQQAQALTLATHYADAQALLRAGRLTEAQALLEEVAAIDPTYSGVQVLLQQVRLLNTLDARYEEALGLASAGNWAAALEVLRAVAASDPTYKDVEQLIATGEHRLLLDEMRTEAQAFYEAEQWVEAVTAYEGLRAVDPDYERAMVEARLFDSYVGAARAALDGRPDSLDALSTAEAYFRKALALRPGAAEIKTERELARLYLAAQEDFVSGRWSDVIIGLEIVRLADPNYANGSARQTLFEAYMGRADAALAAQDYDAALTDYTIAVKLAEQDRSAVLRLFEAYLRTGDALAAQKSYEAAVLMYRKALEVGRWAERSASEPLMAEALLKAEEALAQSNFVVAYEYYREAVYGVEDTRTTVKHVVVAGEYLILIATRYGSTVSAIVAANDIPNPRLIYAGQELIIPIQP
jgi:tetratricopeptide (TPR) repeat protein